MHYVCSVFPGDVGDSTQGRHNRSVCTNLDELVLYCHYKTIYACMLSEFCVRESIRSSVCAFMFFSVVICRAKLCISQQATVMWCLWFVLAVQDDVNQVDDASREYNPVYEDMHRVNKK